MSALVNLTPAIHVPPGAVDNPVQHHGISCPTCKTRGNAMSGWVKGTLIAQFQCPTCGIQVQASNRQGDEAPWDFISTQKRLEGELFRQISKHLHTLEPKKEKLPELLPHPANDNSDVIERLEKLLDAAKAGTLTDFACVYLQPKEFCFSQSFRGMNRPRILMCLDIIKRNILAEYDVEEPDVEC